MKSKQLFAQIAFTFILLICCSVQLSCNDAKSNSDETQMPLAAIIKASKINTNSIYFFVDKSDYRLTVMSDSIKLKSYDVVFGGNPKDDKIQQGDGCTPEGWFKIKAMYPHKKWSKFMWIDYPNAQSQKKFNQAVKNKTISADTDIGGDIGIHGVPQGADEMIAKKFNWTLGCISLTNKDVNELYAVAKVGTRVFIQK
jgi:murein L,D-transpeptidase YafK